MRPERVMASLAMLFLVVTLAGCVDLLSNKEVLTETSWYGRVTDGEGRGVSNATVTLHVLNDRGEVYSRQAQAAFPEPVRGAYTFEHIDLRDGADRAYTTCNATIDNKALTAAGEIRSLNDHARASAMSVDGRNITVITYDGVVDENLTLR